MKRQLHVLACAGFVLVSACSEPADTVVSENWLGDSTVGTVDGVAIPESLFRRLGVNMMQKTAEEMTPEERGAVLDQIVALTLAAREAERQELHQERTVAAEMELRRLQFLAQTVVDRLIENEPPREAELRELYEERIADLSGTEYNARHILVDSEAEAAELIEQLDEGADFAALAMEFSTGPTGPNGGDLGWFMSDGMVAPFSDAVVALDIGEYTASPVQTQFGWHVILLVDVREQQPPGLESMRNELVADVRIRRIEEFVERLRNAATVDVQ